MKPSQWIYLFLLLSVSTSASLFIIVESGEFYQQLYPQKTGGISMGYWAAGLNEIFMAIMAAVWIPNSEKKKKGTGFHFMNLVFKCLLILLFLTTIGGASFQITQKTMSEIQKQENNRRIANLLKTQINDNTKSLDIFTAQNQRINSALSVRRQNKTKDELKQIFRDEKVGFILWVQLIFLILLRFVIQFANLCCVWLAGWVYRNRDYIPTSSSKNNPKSEDSNSKTMTLIKKRNHRNEHKIKQIRGEINQMINSRNSGVSIKDVGFAIKENSEILEKIVDEKNKLTNQHLPKLTQIQDKLRKIYLQEKVGNY